MEHDNALVVALLVRRTVRHPHPPTEMLLLLVSWLYGTPSPDTPPYGLLPNMSESSGTPGENRPGFSRGATLSF